MSVVVGALGWAEEAQQALLSRVRAMLARSHKAGPDGRGDWNAPHVALGHGLLREVPESQHEAQPWQEHGVVLSADVRLDNREELATAFLQAGAPLASDAPDVAFVSRAYQLWGKRSFSRLIGDFAFVLWDPRLGSLLAVRDPFGLRPLYMHRSPTALWFASEIKQLHLLPSVSRTLNEEVIEDFLLFGFRQQKDATFFRDIALVPPAHILEVSREGHLRQTRYWQPQTRPTLHYNTRQAYREHLFDELSRAVGSKMRAIGPVGLMLSGGLDSGTIAGVGAHWLKSQTRDPSELIAYSYVFDEIPSIDERRYFLPLIDTLGISSTLLYPEQYRAFSQRWEAEEPPGSDAYDPSWHWALEKHHARGGRVMLTGFFGETLFLSQGRWQFLDWLQAGQLGKWLQEFLGYQQHHQRSPRLPWRKALIQALPTSVRLWNQVRLLRKQRPPWLEGGLTRLIACARRTLDGAAPPVFAQRSKQAALEIICGAQSAPILWGILAGSANKVGMTYRHPFMDRRLHDFVFSLPLELFFQDGVDRAILRESMAHKIPDCVRLRVQQTLFGDWFDHHASRRQMWGLIQNAATHTRPISILKQSILQCDISDEILKKYTDPLIWLALFADWLQYNEES